MPDPETIGSSPEANVGKCPVVAIGASAGGLEAVTELLEHLPPAFEMALVLVQHLDPDHESRLADILARVTSMKVVQATEGVEIQPDYLYIIPPNTLMTMRECRLLLTTRGKDRARHLPIDHFMCSLAEDLGNRSIGVILSGGGSDGTIGLEAIKSEGGITFAQDRTARHDSMPRQAAAGGVVDFILNPREIASELTALALNVPMRSASPGSLFRNAPELQRILILLRERCGVDFTHYRINTIQRRLASRMALHHLSGLEEYLQFFERNEREAQELFDDILITVTEFFRDPDTFQTLTEEALPLLLKGRRQEEPLRIWVPGCSMGKEVYSIAITVTEAMERLGCECPLQLFGTDVSERAIEAARLGTYPSSVEGAIGPERLKRFFVKVEGGYQISRRIRELCVFSRQDLTRDPPLAKMDLISCRNLLIYLGPVLQRRVLGIFSYALRPGGILMLGSSEAVGALSSHFKPFHGKHRIYLRDGDMAPLILPELPLMIRSRDPGSRRSLLRIDETAILDRAADRILADDYGPPGFLLNSQLRVVKFRGDAGAYLTTPQSGGSLDVLTLVRGDVLDVLRPALDAAIATGAPARERFTTAQGGEVEILVRPVIELHLETHYLVMFETAGHKQRRHDVAEARLGENDKARSSSDLAVDLASTRVYMQRLVEELRTANEEAQSSNEELQSTNEELQTAKEELQSSNEELVTTNEELQSRNVQLNIVNSDLVNLLSSLKVAILMLDRSLRVRRYTPVCERIFNLIPGDVGRPISDLQASVDIPHLIEKLQGVVSSGDAAEEEVQDQSGHWYSVRLQPYRTTEGRIDGVVLQMFDVEVLKRSMQEAARARDYADAIVETVREALVVLDTELRIQSANHSFQTMFGRTMPGTAPPGSIGQSIYTISGARWELPAVRGLLAAALQGNPAPPDAEVEFTAPNGSRSTFLLSARRIGSDAAHGSLLLAIEDITDRKRSAEARYRRLFETAPDGILMMEAVNGTVSDVNPAALRILGRARNELMGRRLLDVLPFEGGEVEGQKALALLLAKEEVRFAEVEFEARGVWRTIETVGNLYREGERRVIQLNLRDITERRRFERQLQQTAKLESLGILAGGIAHDFNNLLASIMGNASLALLDTSGSSRYRSALSDVVRASQRAAELTAQMLAYAGKGRYVVRRVNLSDMVRDIGTLALTSVPKSVRVDMRLAADLPWVEADISQLQQVIMNLLINGAESIEEGRAGFVRITTGLEEFDPAHHHLRIAAEALRAGRFAFLEVEDSGSGMNETVLSSIFDPFFTTKFTGRGLGLAAVQGIVRSHGGALTVASEPGKGTTFRVYLPALSMAAELPTQRAAEPPAPSGWGTVLVVDDEPAVAAMACAILQSHGYHTRTASNGESAIEVVAGSDGELSAVILDLTMPALSGKEALAGIRLTHPGLPVIVSTGYDSSEVGEQFQVMGISGVLQKPYTAQALLQMVKKAIAPETAF